MFSAGKARPVRPFPRIRVYSATRTMPPYHRKWLSTWCLSALVSPSIAEVSLGLRTRPFLLERRQKSQAQANLSPFLYWEACITGMSASPCELPNDSLGSSQRLPLIPRLVVKERQIESSGPRERGNLPPGLSLSLSRLHQDKVSRGDTPPAWPPGAATASTSAPPITTSADMA